MNLDCNPASLENYLAQIEFYFPEGKFKDQKELINETVHMMKERGSLDYSGFKDIDSLKKYTLNSMGDGNTKKYKGISEAEKTKVKKIIFSAIAKCNKKLQIPIKNFVFIRPYFPSKKDRVFGGVMGLATYSCVFHIFVNTNNYKEGHLESTIAHELNHTIYYYHHYEQMMAGHTLLENLIMEGLAEIFREDVIGGDPAPWSIALSKKEAFKILNKLGSKSLFSKNQDSISEIVYGDNKKYKRWTGYSIGYWLVKEFTSSNQNLSWHEIMKLDSNEFLKVIRQK